MRRQAGSGVGALRRLSIERYDMGRNTTTCTPSVELKTGTLLCNAAHADVISPSQGQRAMHGQSVRKGKAVCIHRNGRKVISVLGSTKLAVGNCWCATEAMLIR